MRYMFLILAMVAGLSWGVKFLPLTADTGSTFIGEVISVKDGDTIEVLREGKAVRVRLAHIDCPEGGQAFGKAARQYTSDASFGRTAKVTIEGKPDRYGRLICSIQLDTLHLNRALVRAGLA